jgi:hypothetical protein
MGQRRSSSGYSSVTKIPRCATRQFPTVGASALVLLRPPNFRSRHLVSVAVWPVTSSAAVAVTVAITSQLSFEPWSSSGWSRGLTRGN